MKKLIISLLALALLPVAMWADASRDSVPSNYGGWVNLTDGYTEDKDYGNLKMDVAFDGDYIHLCWVEKNKTDYMRNIWYRRSTDLGRTWEDARIVMQVHEANAEVHNPLSKLMAASNGNVYIAALYDTPTTYGENRKIGTSTVHFIRSVDGGATFSDVKPMGGISSEYSRYNNCMVQSDGNTVVVAAIRGTDDRSSNNINFFYSADGGEQFTILTHKITSGSHNERQLLDLQVSGTRFAAMYRTCEWYSGLIFGNVAVVCGDGSDMHASAIAPICTKPNGDQAAYSYPNVESGSGTYHPQMVLDGESVQVMYRGNPGLDEVKPGGLDYAYTLYRRSDDFGQTWGEAILLPESNGGAGTIAAKGQNVYIITTRNGLTTVYHSHDSGSTWEAVTQTLFPDNNHNPSSDFNIAIDPTDESGLHAYFTGHRFFFAETRDGFRTISRNFSLGAESWVPTYYRNNNMLRVRVDDEGTEHWFMQFSRPNAIALPYGGFMIEEGARDIAFRRVEAEPAPDIEDMALSLADTLHPHHRVVVPMSPSLQQKQAITIECWIRPENRFGFQIAACTDNASQAGSVFTGGWYITQVATYERRLYYEGGICIDTDEYVKGVRVHFDRPSITVEPDAWHHVALTYDDNVAENNVCMYINGKLAATNTIHGNLALGKNPISLGRASVYDGSQGLLDNFAIWSRALTADEIFAHASDAKAINGNDDDCRLLLTFDGTLQDQSQYGNDAVALLDAAFVAHDEIPSAGIASPSVDLCPASTDIYSIDGRKVNGAAPLQKGIYIQNGQKVYVR